MVLKEKINDSVIKIIEIVKNNEIFQNATLMLPYLLRRIIGTKSNNHAIIVYPNNCLLFLKSYSLTK